MADTIRWGVLGAAAIATQRTMPAIHQAPSATLVGLASRSIEKGAAFAAALNVPRVYGSYDALLADPDIDAVYVPLPNRLHFEWSIRALEAGKHVLCEKPLCMSSEEVQKLCDARDRSGRRIEEAFAYRNHPQWSKFDDLMAEHGIGKLVSVHATMAKQFLDPADIRNNPSEGGGAAYDLGSYTISACNRIHGRRPLRLVAALERDPSFGIDRLTSVLMDYGGAHALMTIATQAGTGAWGSHQQLSVLGSKGWMQFNFPYAHARSTACRLAVGDETTVGAFPARVFDFEPANQYVLQIERFSQLLLGRDVASFPIEDSLDIAWTIEAIFRSAHTGAWEQVGTP